MLLTDRKVQASKPGDKLSENAPRGSGRLLLRVNARGTREFFYRSRVGGNDSLHKIGNYPEITLAEARKRVHGLAGSPTTTEAKGTLGELLEAYVGHLKDSGKVSASDVERTILRAIPKTHAIRRKRAAAVTSQDITAIIAARVRAGVTVEANRLRSHLSAAFAFGAKSDNNPQRAAEDNHVRFGITANPVAVVARLDERPNGQPRVLNWKELGAYWKALDAESPVIASTLRFILAMGGQCMQQVLRAEWTDIKHDKEVKLNVLRILDRKGKGEPRSHALPIVPFAQTQLDFLKGNERPFDVTHFTLADAISSSLMQNDET